MNNLLKNVSIFFGTRLNVCIIVLMLFIILFYILQKDDDKLFYQHNQQNSQYIQTNKQNKLQNINILEGNYRIKNRNGNIFKPSMIDKFGINNKINEYFNGANNEDYWKIKRKNDYIIFDKPDSKTCLSVQDGVIKELSYEDCSKKTLCGVEQILNEDNDNQDNKLKTSYFMMYGTDDNNAIIAFGNKLLVFDDNNIKLTKDLSEATQFVLEKV
jgi:hypothetical protein